MSHKLLLGPVHLIGHLRQECAAAMTFADIDSMLVQLELVKTLYAAHGGEHGNLYIEIIQLITGNGLEAGITAERAISATTSFSGMSSPK